MPTTNILVPAGLNVIPCASFCVIPLLATNPLTAAKVIELCKIRITKRIIFNLKILELKLLISGQEKIFWR